MKLLLAGGTGLIGQAFLARAQSTNLHITAVGRRPTGLATEDIVADFADLPAMPQLALLFAHSALQLEPRARKTLFGLLILMRSSRLRPQLKRRASNTFSR